MDLTLLDWMLRGLGLNNRFRRLRRFIHRAKCWLGRRCWLWREDNGRRAPIGKAMPPNEIRRTKMTKLHELFHLDVANGSVLLAITGNEPLNLWLYGVHVLDFAIPLRSLRNRTPAARIVLRTSLAKR